MFVWTSLFLFSWGGPCARPIQYKYKWKILWDDKDEDFVQTCVSLIEVVFEV